VLTAMLVVGAVGMWMAWREDHEGDADVGRLGIVAAWSPVVLADDVRRALTASADLDAVQRMRRAGWRVETDGRATSGRIGPAFSATKR
jgi:hypothetical protein